jgi:hypothetical protein
MRIGRTLIVAGLVLVAAGLILSYSGGLPFKLGRLPGDLLVHGRRSTLYFPLTTCILVSLALSLVIWLLRR